MKKDSFTFSDKLKKSKTLPLSKRIPSRVGGEVKAKRTLFERAQRDLPFIIVAALALLLLPFLSRESGDIDTPSVVWGDGGDTYIEDFNQPKSSEGELALSSFRNPLDLIIRHGDKDASAKDNIDTYGAEDSESSSGYSERSSYNSEDYATAPATSKYGKTVKRSVRNSINRVPTSIGSLRSGSMVSPSGGSGVGHSMAFGSRAKDGAPKVQGPGVRPVALQPLQASGKGRDLTGGDALYAEAARSIGAMNTPGAKSALMEAQLKDVDGKPLGQTKGGAAAAAAGKPGTGGTPSNSWSHKPQTPWWWDIMKDRSQKRWMLWHYNWEKMASDSLIKLVSGFAGCLLTGSSDYKVDKFFGAAGSKKYKCLDSAGNEISGVGDFSEFSKGYTSTSKTKEGGTDTSIDPKAFEQYKAFCAEKHGRVEFTKGDRDGFWDTRFDCLGFSLSYIKDKYETKKQVICDGMYNSPMYINISVTKNKKVKQNALDEMGFYVVGNKKNASYQPEWWDKGSTPATEGTLETTQAQSSECVLYIAKAKQGQNFIPAEFEDEVKKVVVYRVGDYGKQFYPEGNEDPTFDRNLEDYKNKKGKYNSEEEIYWESGDYDNAFNIAQKRIKNECLSEKDLQNLLKPIGKWRTDVNSRIKDLYNEIAICQGDYLKGVKFDPVEMARRDSNWDDKKIIMEDCQNRDVYIHAVPSTHKFSTTITNPGKRTLAFVLEKVEGSVGNGLTKEGTGDEGFVVKKVLDFSGPYAYRVVDNKDGSKTFNADVQIGRSVSETGDKTGAIEATRPGEGLIFWITTNDTTTAAARERAEFAQPKSSDLLNVIGKRSAMCHYRWGCGKGDVCNAQNNNICVDRKTNKYYYAREYNGYMFITKPKTEVDPATIENQNSIRSCDPLCKYLENNQPKGYGVEGLPINPKNLLPLTLEDEGFDTNCPVCNPTDKVMQVPDTGLVCIDPERNGESCPCIKVDNPITPADINPLYVRSDVRVVNPKEIRLPVTPICAKKAVALGNIYVRNPDGTAGEQIDPDADIVDMLLTKNEEEQQTLCPFCSGFGPDEPGQEEDKCTPGMETSIDTSEECVVKLIGDFFPNASYKLCSVLPYDLIYKHMKDCKDYVIEGHASKVYTTGDEENNLRLGFDRAMTIANEIRPVWEDRDKAKVAITPTKDTRGLYTGLVSASQWKEGISWPKGGKRNTLSSPNASPANVTFRLESYGSQYADPSISRPQDWDKGLTKEQRKQENEKWFDIERPNRKVIIRGTPKEE